MAKRKRPNRDPWLKRKRPRASGASSRSAQPTRAKSLDSGERKLCGFFVTVLTPLNGNQNVGRCKDLIQEDDGVLDVSTSCLVGAHCSLGEQGDVAVENGLTLCCMGTQVLAETTTPALEGKETRFAESKETETETPSSVMTFDLNFSDSTPKHKRRKVSNVLSPSTIISSLRKLVTKNGLHVEGQIVKVVENRVAVLFDVYFPSSLFTSTSWKGGSAGAFAISHLSCDWHRREAVLNTEAVSERDMLEIPECQVLGCSLHVKSARFDLQDIFKGLSARDPRKHLYSPGISAAKEAKSTGLWDLPEEVLMSVIAKLLPMDLLRISAVCRKTRLLARSIIPCLNLRLFPHQQAAVQWMLHRETNAAGFSNPLWKCLKTQDDLYVYINCITGDISLEVPPEVRDFHGGLFCDEPGLGKTVTALSLILKTQGLFVEPPDGVEVTWCKGPFGEKLGYYELNEGPGVQRSTWKTRRRQSLVVNSELTSDARSDSPATSSQGGCLGKTRRKLEEDYEKLSEASCVENSAVELPEEAGSEQEQPGEDSSMIWVQCDACTKWRKLTKGCIPPKGGAVWFCRMNTDPEYQNCTSPQQVWSSKDRIHYLEGFYKNGSEPGLERNVTFFKSVLKERVNLLTSETRKGLGWLSNLGASQLAKVATQGLAAPQHLRMTSVTGTAEHYYEDFFKAFGLVPKHDKKKVVRWHYPAKLRGFQFDAEALKSALASPIEETSRVYLSKATLVVVPGNLIDHWKTQIEKHTRHKQLRFCVCVDQKRTPTAHVLAWDYDVVITTFTRLSAEWSNKENSPLIQVHWFRVMLDEGHTLGASLALTNKLQMAINMHASRRWVLTGTPTPDTPNSQLVHLQPMLRFLHEELYGNQYKLWDAAILRPFEAQCEEGRLRLVELLQRCMICARKADLSTIPPCHRKVKLVEFTEKHAASYNELVETVRRNILMADWNDPDHVESLLNPKQWKMKSSTLKNVRLACCVAGQIKVRNSDQDIQETMDMLVQDKLDPASNEYSFIRDSLLYGGHCLRCGEWCRLPMLTPCRHFLCLLCISLDGGKCSLPNCGRGFKMQKPRPRPENPHPKWPVPQDLIELQPSYIQDEWHPEWQATSSSKVAYLVEQLRLLQDANKELPVESRLLEKVIVFSQFLEHISVIKRQLEQAGIEHTGMYSPMQPGNKTRALKNFRESPDCLVLLMDGSSALGLDLSFVTHVYLMEPIWDRSIEEQVVSRAHRMGATRPIVVETLAMRGTIEQQMLEFLQKSSSLSRNHHDPQEAWYLARLAFVRREH